jgi:hypothetical protein
MRKNSSLIVFMVAGIVAAVPASFLDIGAGGTFLIAFGVALGATMLFERLYLKQAKRS